MVVVIVLVKMFGKRPKEKYEWDQLRDNTDLENNSYPMVLVRIPMYNEK